MATIRALLVKNGYWDAEKDCPTEKGRLALEKEDADAAASA